MRSIISTSTALALAAALASGASVREQVAEIRLAPTEVDRLNVLTDSQVIILYSTQYMYTKQDRLVRVRLS